MPFGPLRERLAAKKTLAIDPGAALETAVAVILSPGAGGLELLLIQRAERPDDPWSGHMALPGGRRDPGDPDRLSVAVRETAEEIGVALPGDSLLGVLDDLHPMMPEPRVCIRPFVFGLPARPEARASEEVAGVYWTPLAVLFGGEGTTRMPMLGKSVEVPCFSAPGLPADRVVWGLTYRILSGLRPLLP